MKPGPPEPPDQTGRTDADWLALVHSGGTCWDIAAELNLDHRWVMDRVLDAAVRAEPPRRQKLYRPSVVPVFPAGPLTPSSVCPHHGPLADDSEFVCGICHCGGELPAETVRSLPRRLHTRRAPSRSARVRLIS
jgi:hypothetical protein